MVHKVVVSHVLEDDNSNEEAFWNYVNYRCNLLKERLLENASNVLKAIRAKMTQFSPRVTGAIDKMNWANVKIIDGMLAKIHVEHISPLLEALWIHCDRKIARFKQKLEPEIYLIWQIATNAVYHTLSVFEYQARLVEDIRVTGKHVQSFTFTPLLSSIKLVDLSRVSDRSAFIDSNVDGMVQIAVGKISDVHTILSELRDPDPKSEIRTAASTAIMDARRRIIEPLLVKVREKNTILSSVQMGIYDFVNEVNAICRSKIIEMYKRLSIRVDDLFMARFGRS